MHLDELDPLSPHFLADPYRNFRRLRDESPIHHVASRNMWVITRYDDVIAAARNTAVFSSTGGVGYDWNQRPMMPMKDPPDHTVMRRMVARHFTVNAISAFAPRVESLVQDVLARALERRDVDFVNDIAVPLSLGTMAELLGVPREVRKHLRRWSQGTIEDLAGALAPIPARRVDELRREFNAQLRTMIEERRATRHQKKTAIDVISVLVAAAEEDGALTQSELVAFCVLLFVAGYETTVNAMANGMLALIDNPAELEKLREDRMLLANGVEEMTRYDGPVLSFFRNTLSDVKFGDKTIPRGAKVMLAFAAANRDERKFPKAHSFQVDRDGIDHLAYGSGVHFCLGAALARLQMRSLFAGILAHVGEVKLRGEPVRTSSVLFRGVRSMPVTLKPARTSMLLTARESAPSLAVAAPVEGPIEFEPRPYQLAVKEEVLLDLKQRLAQTRWPDEVEWAGWDYGTSVRYLKELVGYWQDGFDWRAQEAKLNALPQFLARVGDLDIHYVHLQAKRPTKKPPLLLLHGWPGSYWLYSRIAPTLRDAGHDVVIASLPGFPGSSAPRTRGMGTVAVAELLTSLMVGIGYNRFGVVGEDIGASVASRIGLVHPQKTVGLHLNMPFENPPRDQMKELTEEERAWLKSQGRFRDKELTHLFVHERQPQSMSFGLADSPVGLAGWFIDKFRSWSDSRGDVERRFSKDDLLTNVMLYWVHNSIGSALRLYYESRQMAWFLASGERIETPTAIALCKHELLQPPRRWIERAYNLQRLTHFPVGGHFGAWEEPTLVAEDICAFFGEVKA
jgi:cytochrome P450/pimeloyl-ACP methyl ester carboxylesterase